MKKNIFAFLLCIIIVLLVLNKWASEEKYRIRIIDTIYLVEINSGDIEIGLHDSLSFEGYYSILVDPVITEIDYDICCIIAKQVNSDNNKINYYMLNIPECIKSKGFEGVYGHSMIENS